MTTKPTLLIPRKLADAVLDRARDSYNVILNADDHVLTRDELIAAVSKRAESEECAPEAAEIIKVARETRRDRAERETREELDARQSPNPRAVQGRYQRDDPAGWQ